MEPYDPGLTIYRKKWPNYLPWHAHITALTVAPSARRLGHATRLTEALEQVGDEADAWFVDLFVRVENEAAILLYKKMGCVFFHIETYRSLLMKEQLHCLPQDHRLLQ